jgi:hypothetical protein
MAKATAQTGKVSLYQVDAAGQITSLWVKVGEQEYKVRTNDKNPTAFAMAAITCLKDAFLQRKQVTVNGQRGSSIREPLKLTSIKLH